ncbi:hypothetical protein K402DRAFT_408410 [Aulographum hederae CBS 113979]|uniref:Uncharacterized protein n=1 Tax=Aulographum hederae CBS 113979 TaxID=1176131 RepID=A0A6G1GL28_9PEZI|nr:hypothetical protein K402DRAFT_408410 [Aulographum hederae CBS 113979]
MTKYLLLLAPLTHHVIAQASCNSAGTLIFAPLQGFAPAQEFCANSFPNAQVTVTTTASTATLTTTVTVSPPPMMIRGAGLEERQILEPLLQQLIALPSELASAVCACIRTPATATVRQPTKIFVRSFSNVAECDDIITLTLRRQITVTTTVTATRTANAACTDPPDVYIDSVVSDCLCNIEFDCDVIPSDATNTITMSASTSLQCVGQLNNQRTARAAIFSPSQQTCFIIFNEQATLSPVPGSGLLGLKRMSCDEQPDPPCQLYTH